MHLTVHHRTEYRFTEPQRRIMQLLRVTPPSFNGQQIIDWQINVECDVRLLPGRDGFGNETTMLYCDGPIDHMVLDVQGEVLTENRHGLVEGVAEPLPPELFLQSTRLTAPTSAISELARDLAGREKDRIALLHLVMETLHKHVRFDTGQTYVDRTAGAAFAEGHGVCQDHAHILVAVAREMGVPARYVSGHLFQREQSGRQPAAHAWAEAHVDGLGWVGFDAANNVCPEDAYVRVAIGLDYRDAAPLSGSRAGGGQESLHVGVTVAQSQGQSQS